MYHLWSVIDIFHLYINVFTKDLAWLLKVLSCWSSCLVGDSGGVFTLRNGYSQASKASNSLGCAPQIFNHKHLIEKKMECPSPLCILRIIPGIDIFISMLLITSTATEGGCEVWRYYKGAGTHTTHIHMYIYICVCVCVVCVCELHDTCWWVRQLVIKLSWGYW